MARAKALKLTIRVVPGRTSSAVQVKGAGQFGHILMGLVNVHATHQALPSGTDAKTVAEFLCDQAKALIAAS